MILNRLRDACFICIHEVKSWEGVFVSIKLAQTDCIKISLTQGRWSQEKSKSCLSCNRKENTYGELPDNRPLLVLRSHPLMSTIKRYIFAGNARRYQATSEHNCNSTESDVRPGPAWEVVFCPTCDCQKEASHQVRQRLQRKNVSAIESSCSLTSPHRTSSTRLCEKPN